MSQRGILERLSVLDTNTVSDALDFLQLKGATYGLQPLWDCLKIVGRASTVKVGIKHNAAPSVHLLTPVVDAIKGIRGTIIDAHADRAARVRLRAAGARWCHGNRIEDVVELAERIGRRQAVMVQDVRDGKPVSEVMYDSKFEASHPKTSSPATAVSSKEACPEDQELSALFAGLDTPAVSDALDKLGIPGQAFDIMPLANYSKVTIGPAFTVRYIPASNPPGSVGDFIDDVAAGDVVVIDNGGRTDCTVWGDIMTQYTGLRGIAGTVIDGVCRDVSRALNDGYPVFTAGRWMRTGKDRVQVGAVNETIGIGKAHVRPRDIVVADANGVVFVPRDQAREVAELAQKIEKSEDDIRELISAGVSISETRQKLGYPTLQRKVKNH
ncbi:uncharacterized protein TRUGW13939_07211 [Talaromyces rugulosus]|uniref:Uncharacterized protein n=1 Tax=Talaromyces rugulosus TaxID=121627 RepID=A0A7H8R163_TALRU|nr:uncharacterized protein TRUGW13939_07211 [Talaromyces rugulosus]QKX60069.1 hypothetical protein TRUGW13939_07211 [Talaromyces rugulosus]